MDYTFLPLQIGVWMQLLYFVIFNVLAKYVQALFVPKVFQVSLIFS